MKIIIIALNKKLSFKLIIKLLELSQEVGIEEIFKKIKLLSTRNILPHFLFIGYVNLIKYLPQNLGKKQAKL